MKTKNIVLVLLMVLLLAGGGLFARKMLAADPEAVFYQALESHMSTKYIGQRYVNDFSYAVITSETHTDFSDPAKPKTMLHDTYKVDGKKIIEVETITTSDQAEYGKIIYVDSSQGDKSIQDMYKTLTGKWVKFSSKDEAALVDPYNFAGGVNQTQGEILVGNYPAIVRSEILAMYKSSKALGFDKQKVKTERLDGKSAFKYVITIDRANLAKINQKAEEKLGLRRSDFIENMQDVKMTMWVDKKSGRVIRISSQHAMRKTTVDFTYPDTLSVATPSGAKTLSEWGVTLPTSADRL